MCLQPCVFGPSALSDYVSLYSPQAHDSPVRAMTWSHNDMWMLTADHGGYVKYWQSNMNNVKMFQAHKEAIREARSIHNLPFSVVNPSLLLLLLLFPLKMIDKCTSVLSQHCTDLFLLPSSLPVAHDELCILIFSIHNYYVQKRLIFTVLLNKVLIYIYIQKVLAHVKRLLVYIDEPRGTD